MEEEQCRVSPATLVLEAKTVTTYYVPNGPNVIQNTGFTWVLPPNQGDDSGLSLPEFSIRNDGNRYSKMEQICEWMDSNKENKAVIRDGNLLASTIVVHKKTGERFLRSKRDSRVSRNLSSLQIIS